MDRVLQFALSEQSYLDDALRVLRTANASGVLRIVATSVNGRIGLSGGKPCAAHNSTTGSAGDDALREMRNAGVAVFHFAAMGLPSDLSEFAISERFAEHLEQMAVDARISKFDELFQNFMEALPEEDQQLLNSYRQLHKEEERQAFLAENPRFVRHGGKDEQKLKVVRLYSQLNNEMDKRAFLKSNPDFYETMIAASALSYDQRRELARAQFAVADGDAEFVNFCKELFGNTYPDLNKAQAMMLKGTYLRLATEQNRRNFLSTNPVLDDNAPVMRGEEVLPYVRIHESTPHAEELSDAERLAALKLQAVDFTGDPPPRPAPYLRLRDMQPMDIETPLPKKGAIAGAVAFGALTLGLLCFFAFNQGNAPVPVGENERSPRRAAQLPPPSTVTGQDPQSSNVQSGAGSNIEPLAVGEAPDAEMDSIEKLYAQGHFDEAAGRMERYVARNPGSVSARIALVRCYMAAKQKKKARMLCLSIFKTMRLNQEDDRSLTRLWQLCFK
jgi:thioredoxin-like negative regulator of GroEL